MASNPRSTAGRPSIAYSRALNLGFSHAKPSALAASSTAAAAAAAVLRVPQAAAPRSLTEELEKIEQSITLTLQEIDQNFSTSHRIITSSILPVVEQYAQQSHAVWQSSKFWKEFFESSANVSLAGYEELNSELDDAQDGPELENEHEQSEIEPSRVTEVSATMDYDYHHVDNLVNGHNYNNNNNNNSAHAARQFATGDDYDDSSFSSYVQGAPSLSSTHRPAAINNDNTRDFSKYKFDDDDDLETEKTISGTANFIKSLNLGDQSTPRARAQLHHGEISQQHSSVTVNANADLPWASMVSPFEELRSELTTGNTNHDFDTSNSLSIPQFANDFDPDDLSPAPPIRPFPRNSATAAGNSGVAPRTPGRAYHGPQNSTIDEEDTASIMRTPESSPFSPFVGSARRPAQGNNNVLLHRVLDKKWTVHATPKCYQSSPRRTLPNRLPSRDVTTTPKNAPINYASKFSSSPLDSPPVSNLNSVIFSSPERG
ncbi:DASH complex subunit Ask1-domain-containing protein [Lipomyces japonicus]|uniref:DASH complex subunit Ask1-domain-containing protein n=1 Tax=Lipomyces japonicus TaxID=56871 RepID=UPI0034CF1D9C